MDFEFLVWKNDSSKSRDCFFQTLPIENGTPQGSVSNPILFNLMINDIFHNVDTGIGRSLYADDGALWKRGRNVLFVENKMQKAVNEGQAVSH